MPINILRLNNPRPQPSDRITFIKALPGPTSKYAEDFLERIAAISHPIMKSHSLSITTLEEHEPNPEFIGRNFNGGEIIQLVLKAPYSGHWLSFRQVQMVMMHELAHCVQMNHGRDFWKVNNVYKSELKELWARGYTGDGLWGRGQTLLSGEYDVGGRSEHEILPHNLCGGTFRSRRRKRRRRTGIPEGETYAEAKRRRIAKKFGANGSSLGSDEITRVKLENGQKVKGKPRVANSSRGRELRVAAAMARFGEKKEEQPDTKGRPEKEELDDESTTDDEDGPDGGADDGCKVKDSQGHGMIRVCGDEDGDDIHVKQEMEELQELNDQPPERATRTETAQSSKDINPSIKPAPLAQVDPVPLRKHRDLPMITAGADTTSAGHPSPPAAPGTSSAEAAPTQEATMNCPICSMLNEPSALVCEVCSHVLDPSSMKGHWRCQSQPCRTTGYTNAVDCGLCGACGVRKSETAS